MASAVAETGEAPAEGAGRLVCWRRRVCERRSSRLPVGDGAFPSVCPPVAMDTAATEQTAPQPVPDGPAAADTSVPEAPASADDRPQKHGITDELAHLFLKRFLPADTRFVMKSYKYRPIASLGEGYTTVRKVLEVMYRDKDSGKEDVAVFVVKVPSEYKSC